MVSPWFPDLSHGHALGMFTQMMRGALAGAAGATALNAVTYADMAWRARPSSSTPEQTVENLAGKANVEVPGEGEDRDNRLSGLGALSGIVTGIAVGAVYGVARSVGFRPPAPLSALLVGAAAMAGANGPMALLGVSDPREWSTSDWVSDVVPHLAYGLTTVAAYVDDG